MENSEHERAWSFLSHYVSTLYFRQFAVYKKRGSTHIFQIKGYNLVCQPHPGGLYKRDVLFTYWMVYAIMTYR